jgi:hypothetical protein
MLFSQTMLLLERKKLFVLDFPLVLNILFKKRAVNLIKVHKIAISTLKSPFRF